MGYLSGFLITGLATVLCSFANRYLDHSNLVMIYLLVIVYIATRYGRGPSIFAAVLSVSEFDYFCVKPHYSLAVSDWQYLITFSVMLTIAMLITALSSEAQRQNQLARLKEDRSEALRALSADLSLTRGREKLVEVALKHIRRTFDAMVGIYLPDISGGLCEYTVEAELIKLDRQGNELANWTFQNKQATGLGRGLYSNASSAYLPLIASEGIVGVLQVSPRNKTLVLAGSDEFELLETFANQTALCIEVAALSEQTQLAAIQIEREQLRNALLSSVSHDLRTPLATITGASSSLVEDNASLNESQKQELAQVILEEAEHLNNLVRNLLEMTKLESGPLVINKTWHSIEKIVGACMTRMERHLKDRHVQIKLPRDLPLLPFDDILMQQVLLNLLENAIKYTPDGSDIEIEAKLDDREGSESAQWLCISISDKGPGLKSGEEEKIFTKFYRSQGTQQRMGVGLGLAICKAIVQAHGGSISAANRPQGGAEFKIKLPLATDPPSLIAEPPESSSQLDSSSSNNQKVEGKTAEQTS